MSAASPLRQRARWRVPQLRRSTPAVLACAMRKSKRSSEKRYARVFVARAVAARARVHAGSRDDARPDAPRAACTVNQSVMWRWLFVRPHAIYCRRCARQVRDATPCAIAVDIRYASAAPRAVSVFAVRSPISRYYAISRFCHDHDTFRLFRYAITDACY